MTLVLEVGRLARLMAAGQTTNAFEAELRRAENALHRQHAKDYHEPFEVAEGSGTWKLVDPHGLHALRRLAAHHWLEGKLPAALGPDTDWSEPDPSVEEYYSSYEDEALADFWEDMRARRNPPTPDYEHLMLHADDSGLYLPLDFENPIEDEQGGLVGSSAQLHTECSALLELLEVESVEECFEELLELQESGAFDPPPADKGADPPGTIPAADWEPIETADSEAEADEPAVPPQMAKRGKRSSEKPTGPRWQRYRSETLCCISLIMAAEASMQTASCLHLSLSGAAKREARRFEGRDMPDSPWENRFEDAP